MLVGQYPKSQLGLVDCLWEDCQPDLFAHTLPLYIYIDNLNFSYRRGDFLARLCLGPSVGSLVFVLLNCNKLHKTHTFKNTKYISINSLQ